MELIKQYLKWKRVKEIGKKGEGHIGRISPTNRTSPTWPPCFWPTWAATAAAQQPSLAQLAPPLGLPLSSFRPAPPSLLGPTSAASRPAQEAAAQPGQRPHALANPRAAPWPPGPSSRSQLPPPQGRQSVLVQAPPQRPYHRPRDSCRVSRP